MKKNLLLVVALLLGAVAAFAQPRAVGLRVGSGLEASYQHSLGESNMISIDFGMIYPNARFAAGQSTGINPDGTKEKIKWDKEEKEMYDVLNTSMLGMDIAATYDWINPGGVMIPWNHKGSWNWYAGVGLDVTYMKLRINAPGEIEEGDAIFKKISHWGSVGIAGRIGVEYNFWFPLQLSFDYRPTFGPTFNSFKEQGVTMSSVAYNLTGLYAGAICFAVRYKF